MLCAHRKPQDHLPKAKEFHTIRATSSGFISRLDALAVGVASWRLGAGRERKEDAVQFGAGVELHAQLGDSIEEGDALMTLYTDTPEKFERAIELASSAVDFSQQAPPKREMILGRVS